MEKLWWGTEEASIPSIHHWFPAKHTHLHPLFCREAMERVSKAVPIVNYHVPNRSLPELFYLFTLLIALKFLALMLLQNLKKIKNDSDTDT